MPFSPTSLLSQLTRIVRLADTEILDVYQHFSPNSFDRKADNSPLTEADLRANQVIEKELRTLTPDIPFLSEENRQVDYDIRRRYERCWMVDPLDGTKEFIKKNGEFTVNIALLENGRPVLGVVSVPCTGQVYGAARNRGAWRLDGEERIVLSAPSFDPASRACGSWPLVLTCPPKRKPICINSPIR